MKNGISKIIAVILSAVTLISATPVLAASSSIGSISSSTTIGEDTIQNKKTSYETVGLGSTKTEVYLTVAESNFVVSTPTTIVLNGKSDKNGKNIGKYSVKVSGDMAGDNALVVRPDSTSIMLHQKGKNDVSAEIRQEQTEFTYEDLANNKTAAGTITANALSAGNWNSSFNFTIEMKSMYRYYSSVKLAAQDANNGNYDNADVETATDPNAVAGLINSKAGAEICMLKSEDNCKAFTLSNNTRFNLNGKKLSFSPSNNLVFEKDLTLFNGNLSGQDAKLINGTTNNTNGKLKIENVNIDLKCTANLKSAVYAIDNSCAVNNIDNLSVVLSGDGNSAYSSMGLSFRNGNSTSEVNHYQFDSTVKNAKYIRGGQIAGTSTFTNPDIDIVSDSVVINAGLAFLSVGSEKPNVIVNKANVNVTTVFGNTVGISRSTNGKLIINGGKIEASTTKERKGLGVGLDGSANLEINSSIENPVTVFGKQWGIQTSPLGKAIINGGSYTATDHTAYISGNADIYDAEFYIAKRDKYESQYLDSPFGMYFGGSSCPESAVVNLHRCKIGQGEFTSYNTVSAKRNEGYKSPRDINFYDCELYQGHNAIFSYNYTEKNNIGNTRFNLYDGTKLLRNNGTVITKDVSDPLIANWKTIKRNTHDVSDWIGNWLINGYVGRVDKETGEILEIYLLDDANVYDYRK